MKKLMKFLNGPVAFVSIYVASAAMMLMLAMQVAGCCRGFVLQEPDDVIGYTEDMEGN